MRSSYAWLWVACFLLPTTSIPSTHAANAMSARCENVRLTELKEWRVSTRHLEFDNGDPVRVDETQVVFAVPDDNGIKSVKFVFVDGRSSRDYAKCDDGDTQLIIPFSYDQMPILLEMWSSTQRDTSPKIGMFCSWKNDKANPGIIQGTCYTLSVH